MLNLQNPYLTCIIASYNTANAIPIVLASLTEQDLSQVEIIVQDGNSQDDTAQIVQEWQKKLPQLHFFSEKDCGVYDAWNKALVKAQGEWIFFMGADDICVTRDSLKRVKDTLQALDDNTIYLASPVIMRGVNQQPDARAALYPAKNLNVALAQGMALPHQGLFHRKRLFEKAQFDTQYPLAGDYEFLARTYAMGNVFYEDTPYISMTIGGLSSALDTMWCCSKEQWKISRKYFPKALPWKLGLRHTRNVGYAIFSKLFGLKNIEKFDDFLRKIRRRPSLWTKS